jgi:hypothetical protein
MASNHCVPWGRALLGRKILHLKFVRKQPGIVLLQFQQNVSDQLDVALHVCSDSAAESAHALPIPAKSRRAPDSAMLSFTLRLIGPCQ